MNFFTDQMLFLLPGSVYYHNTEECLLIFTVIMLLASRINYNQNSKNPTSHRVQHCPTAALSLPASSVALNNNRLTVKNKRICTCTTSLISPWHERKCTCCNKLKIEPGQTLQLQWLMTMINAQRWHMIILLPDDFSVGSFAFGQKCRRIH